MISLLAAKLTVMKLASGIRNLDSARSSFNKVHNKASGDSLLAKEHANIAYMPDWSSFQSC